MFDGHGKYGHEVAEFVNSFFKNFVKEIDEVNTIILKEAFAKCSFELNEYFCKVKLEVYKIIGLIMKYFT